MRYYKTNVILMIGILCISCKETITDSPHVIDYKVVINEINYHSSDNFNPQDWLEIYNLSTDTINIGHWLIKDNNDNHIFSIPANTLLLPDQYLVFCKDTSSFKTFYPDIDHYFGDLGFGLGRSNDYVRLFDSSKLLVDEVNYNDAGSWPAEADGNGPTLELINPSLDNTLGENWIASNGNGTPGAINSIYSADE